MLQNIIPCFLFVKYYKKVGFYLPFNSKFIQFDGKGERNPHEGTIHEKVYLIAV